MVAGVFCVARGGMAGGRGGETRKLRGRNNRFALPVPRRRARSSSRALAARPDGSDGETRNQAPDRGRHSQGEPDHSGEGQQVGEADAEVAAEGGRDEPEQFGEMDRDGERRHQPRAVLAGTQGQEGG